jgi:hypothetical protein
LGAEVKSECLKAQSRRRLLAIRATSGYKRNRADVAERYTQQT